MTSSCLRCLRRKPETFRVLIMIVWKGRRHKRMRKLFLIILAAGATAFAASYDTAKAGMDAERLAKIPVRIKAFVEKGTIAGAVMLIERHGVVASLEAVGYQEVESKKPMR